MRVLVVTSEWPSQQFPYSGIFIVQEVSYLRKAGLDVDVFHFRGRMQPWNYMLAWLRLRILFTKKRYDVVHAQFGQSGMVTIPSPYPLVVTFRGSDLQGIVDRKGRYTFAGKILGWISRQIAAKAAEVVVVSEKLKLQLPDRPVHLIPGGIDLELFKPTPQQSARQKLGLSLTKRYALFAADPNDPVKRYSLASAAVQLAREEEPRLELLVTRQVPHQEMPLYMNASDVLLLTSVHEGSSNVVKEALACNLPIVSVDVGDIRERIGNLEGCAICSSSTPNALSQALLSVLSSSCRTKGRTTLGNLSADATAKKLIQVYSRALSQTCET